MAGLFNFKGSYYKFIIAVQLYAFLLVASAKLNYYWIKSEAPSTFWREIIL
jgi:hypothetical protein